MEKTMTISTEVRVYNDVGTLSEEDLKLLSVARNIANQAHAPYSGFYVGAAVLLNNGIIVSGNNQENAAYPSGLCAERVALFYASSQYPNQPIKAIAITAQSEKLTIKEPVSPCGACRQALAEYEVKFETPVKIIMAGQSGPVYISSSVSSLLPLMFNRNSLEK